MGSDTQLQVDLQGIFTLQFGISEARFHEDILITTKCNIGILWSGIGSGLWQHASDTSHEVYSLEAGILFISIWQIAIDKPNSHFLWSVVVERLVEAEGN